MITLHTFGPMFGLPDPSPFVTKADILLKMSGLPYESKTGGLRGAPKGKLPYITDGSETIGDSTLIRMHLERKYSIDFDKNLSAAEKGFAWATEKLLEDHLYWAAMRWRWLDDANFSKGPALFFASIPMPIRPLIKAMVRRSVAKNLQGQGLGRHSDLELTLLVGKALESLSAILGDKPYLMGNTPCGADATAFAFTLSALCSHFESPLRTLTERHANLVAYRDRLLKAFYPAAS